MKDIVRYGGQAVIEGVMMRGPGSVATCVRTSSGEILTRREAEIRPQDRRRRARFPVLRGMPAIFEVLLCGMRRSRFPPARLARTKNRLPRGRRSGTFQRSCSGLTTSRSSRGAYEWLRFAADAEPPSCAR